MLTTVHGNSISTDIAVCSSTVHRRHYAVRSAIAATAELLVIIPEGCSGDYTYTVILLMVAKR